MMKSLTNLFRVPSAHTLAQRELEEAQRKLLEARSGVEYAQSMVSYHTARVDRLQRYVRQAA